MWFDPTGALDIGGLLKTTARGDELLALYLGGYLFLMLTLAHIVGSLAETGTGAVGLYTVIAGLQARRLRWALLALLLSLAGLPPFYFFGLKLGLLSLLLHTGAWLTVVGAVILVLLGWLVYYGACVRTLITLYGTALTPVWQCRLSGVRAAAITVAMLLCGLGLWFIDDATLLVAWLLDR